MHYSIAAYGCSPTVYKVIDEAERGIYTDLLTVELPRPKDVHTNYDMKPSWYLNMSYGDKVEEPHFGPIYPDRGAHRGEDGELEEDDSVVIAGDDVEAKR